MSNECQYSAVGVEASLFKLAKSDQYLNAEDLLQAGREMHPGVSEAVFEEGVNRLANRLWDTDHGGFRTEYMRIKRRPRKPSAPVVGGSDK